jgi:hypothetical protein
MNKRIDRNMQSGPSIVGDSRDRRAQGLGNVAGDVPAGSTSLDTSSLAPPPTSGRANTVGEQGQFTHAIGRTTRTSVLDNAPIGGRYHFPEHWFLDADGTLLNSEKSLDDTIDAMLFASLLGVRLTINTSKTWKETVKLREELENLLEGRVGRLLEPGTNAASLIDDSRPSDVTQSFVRAVTSLRGTKKSLSELLRFDQPVIVENGAGIAIPAGYELPLGVTAYPLERTGWRMVANAAPIAQLFRYLDSLLKDPESGANRFVHNGQMSSKIIRNVRVTNRKSGQVKFVDVPMGLWMGRARNELGSNDAELQALTRDFTVIGRWMDRPWDEKRWTELAKKFAQIFEDLGGDEEAFQKRIVQSETHAPDDCRLGLLDEGLASLATKTGELDPGFAGFVGRLRHLAEADGYALVCERGGTEVSLKLIPQSLAQAGRTVDKGTGLLRIASGWANLDSTAEEIFGRVEAAGRKILMAGDGGNDLPGCEAAVAVGGIAVVVGTLVKDSRTGDGTVRHKFRVEVGESGGALIKTDGAGARALGEVLMQRCAEHVNRLSSAPENMSR